MAWQGEITDFKQSKSGWEIHVSYFNDLVPQERFVRVVNLPFSATKQEALAAIQARGQEVKRIANLSDENFVGMLIPIT